MLDSLPTERGEVVAHIPTPRRLNGVAVGAILGSLYFLAAQLSQGLLLDEGVAVFWPAAALSSGTLIALGPGARWPVTGGAAIATLAVHLIKGESLWAGAALGLCNAVETLIIAGLINRYFGLHFSFDRLRSVVGLLLAAIAGTAASGIGGALIYRLLEGPSTPLVTTWSHWFASDVVGVIAGAPLVIGLFEAARAPPPRDEVAEGAIALTVLGVTTAVIISLPAEPWQTVVPLALLFPMLLWLAARCRPVFAAGGAFIVSLTIVGTTIEGIGHFGDPSIPVDDRIVEAQAGILVVSLGALVLAALFAERRKSETRLARTIAMLERERNNKLLNIQAATSSIVHEVRQPLTGVTARSSAVRRLLKRSPIDVGRVEQLLYEIENAAFRTDEVLDNVRRLFQDADSEPEPVDVNSLALGVLQILRGELSDHGIETDIELETRLPHVMGHRIQLQEVIVNLVHNSIDAMASVEARRRALTVRTRPDGGKAIVIEVEDSGQGIEPERLGSIFEAFVTTKPNGTGLGLAICSRIVERHGGQLIASSDGKSGALFQIALPVAPAMPTASPAD